MEDMCINPMDHSFTLPLSHTSTSAFLSFYFIFLFKFTRTKIAWQSISQHNKEIMIHKIYKEEVILGNTFASSEKVKGRKNWLTLQHGVERNINQRQGSANANSHWQNKRPKEISVSSVVVQSNYLLTRHMEICLIMACENSFKSLKLSYIQVVAVRLVLLQYGCLV